MRKNIVHPGADELKYEIREIVEVAKKLEATGTVVRWENIGDPVAKGEKVPQWIKDIIGKAVQEDVTYSYSPTKGLLKTREYIVYERNIEGGIQITVDDILFFNGLGDAIAKIYSSLSPRARIIGPNPAYPTHSSAEAVHSGSPHITYKLDPNNSWYPDLDDLRNKVKYNPEIVGILIINPDNPTGVVYPQKIISEIVAIAKEYDLFVVSDEIYSNIFYGGQEHKKLASVIGDVPGIAMRGLSKEIPWPGARCGWVEFYNRDKDVMFDRYTKSLIDAKMLEVCSTTLPQKVLPEIMGDRRYYPYLAERNSLYEKRNSYVYETLSKVPALTVHKTHGAFYMTILFNEGVLKEGRSVPLSKETEAIIAPYVSTSAQDKRFVYYLLASTGICVVPLSTGFNSDLYGFRITLLEQNEEVFKDTIGKIAEMVEMYTSSV